MTVLSKPAPRAVAELTAPTLEYTSAADWVDHKLGYSQRDAHLKFPEQGDYLDFWHYILDEMFGIDNVSNDSLVSGGSYSFVEFRDQTLAAYPPEDWRSVIATVWAEEFPDCYTVWMSW